MRVPLQPNRKPVRVKARRYSPEQIELMEKYAKELLDMGFAMLMPIAAWQAAPLILPKQGSKAKSRMAIDLRPVNAATVKESCPMPNL